MTPSSRRRTVAFVAGGSAIAAPIAFLTAPALAVDQSCSGVSGAVEVLPGVCELRFDAAGEYSFAPPEGVAKVAAVLVGAGGGARGVLDDFNYDNNAFPVVWMEVYGGGGGEVLYIDNIGPAEISIEVGAGGAPEAPGGETSLGGTSADGGESSNGESPANSGTGKEGRDVRLVDGHNWSPTYGYRTYIDGGGGGGAKSAVDENSPEVGGEGYKFSELDSVDAELFPAADDEPTYGNGGDVIDETTYLGGESVSAFAPTGVNGATPAGTGGTLLLDARAEVHGGYVTAEGGTDGLVALRWLGEATSESDDSLPETGSELGLWTLTAALASVVGGLGILSRARRRTNA